MSIPVNAESSVTPAPTFAERISPPPKHFPSNEIEVQLEALRREHAAVRQRCDDTERLIRQRSQALEAERARLAGEEIAVEGKWLDLHTLFPVDPDASLAFDTASEMKEGLFQQRTAVAEEWQRVHHATLAAQERVKQANELGLEQAKFWEARLAAFNDAEESWNATLETRLAEQTRRAQEELSRIEASGFERLESAALQGEELTVEALAIGRSKTRQCEALAEAAQQQQDAKSKLDPHVWELELKVRLETQEAAMSARQEQAEVQTMEALRAEVRREEEVWFENLETRAEEEALAECHRAEEDARRYEMHMQTCCLEERARLAARDEACTEAWLVYAWAEAEARISEEAAAMRQEAALQEEQLYQQTISAEAGRQQAHIRSSLERRSEQEEACTQDFAAAEVLQEEERQREIAMLLRERQTCEEELIAFRQEQQASWPSQIVAAKEKTKELVVQDFQEVLLDSAAREDAYREQIWAAEVSKEEARLTAQQLSARSDQMRHEYKLRVNDLLATTAHLEEEKILLSEERRRILIGQHKSTLMSPRLSPAASVSSPLGPSVPAGPSMPFASFRSPDFTSPAANASEKIAPSSMNLVQVPLLQDDSLAGGSKLGQIFAEMPSSHSHSPLADGFGSFLRSTTAHPEPAWTSMTNGISEPGPLYVPPAQSAHPGVGPRQLGDSHGDDQSIPQVYQAAIAMVEHYGWHEVHDCGPEWTALHWGASEGRADVCARLLAAKADPHLPDHAGRTAIDYARAAGDRRVMEMLEASL